MPILKQNFSLIIYLCVVSSCNGAVFVCKAYSGLNDFLIPTVSRGINSEWYSVTAHGWSLLPTTPYGRCGQRCLLKIDTKSFHAGKHLRSLYFLHKKPDEDSLLSALSTLFNLFFYYFPKNIKNKVRHFLFLSFLFLTH